MFSIYKSGCGSESVAAVSWAMSGTHRIFRGADWESSILYRKEVREFRMY